MDLAEALDRIETIHTHLARGEQYRGYHPAALALSGVVGLIAGLAQPDLDPIAFVRYWVVVGLSCAVLAGSATVYRYVTREDSLARRGTRIILRQFLPCLLAGVVLTVALSREMWLEHAIRLLPGLWALVYGLGVVSSLPYLPRLANLVAAWYLVIATVLLLGTDEALAGPGIGVTFGVGQLLAAAVLFFEEPKGAKS